MIIIRFITPGLVHVDPGKNSTDVFVKLQYEDGTIKTLSQPLDGKQINYYNSTIMRNHGFVSFYENGEVFGIPQHEKAAMNKSAKAAKPEEEENSKMNVKTGKQKSNSLEIKLDKSEDDDLDDFMSNMKW